MSYKNKYMNIPVDTNYINECQTFPIGYAINKIVIITIYAIILIRSLDFAFFVTFETSFTAEGFHVILHCPFNIFI